MQWIKNDEHTIECNRVDANELCIEYRRMTISWSQKCAEPQTNLYYKYKYINWQYRFVASLHRCIDSIKFTSRACLQYITLNVAFKNLQKHKHRHIIDWSYTIVFHRGAYTIRRHHCRQSNQPETKDIILLIQLNSLKLSSFTVGKLINFSD